MTIKPVRIHDLDAKGTHSNKLDLGRVLSSSYSTWVSRCSPQPHNTAESRSLPPSPVPFVPFDRRGLTDRSQGCTIIAWYGPGWSAPIILKQSCLAGQGLCTAWCHDGWRPLIKARRGPEIDVQKFKYWNSIWKIKAVRARLECCLCVVRKQVRWQSQDLVWTCSQPGGTSLLCVLCFHTITFRIHHRPGGFPSIIPILTSKLNTGE